MEPEEGFRERSGAGEPGVGVPSAGLKGDGTD